MPQSKQDVSNDNSTVKQEPPKYRLVPDFDKEPDVKLSEVGTELQLSGTDAEIVDQICPHYTILKKRYREYKNPDPTGNSDGIPCRIDRIHELAPMDAVLAQSADIKSIKVTPHRIIKCFVYEVDPTTGKQERKTKMIIDKTLQGERVDGSLTTIADIRVGYYKYPKQMQQDLDGFWTPVNNRLEKVWYLDWNDDYALSFSNIGNPYTKKYAVWHPDGTMRKYYRKEDFFSMTDDEAIEDIERTFAARERK